MHVLIHTLQHELTHEHQMQFFKDFRVCKISRVVINIVHQRCKSSGHNLRELLRTMPKEVTHTAALIKQRQKLKEKYAKYTPSTVYLQVLGSGAIGAPRCLYMFTDQTRYLFNCGEGTQRLAHEHKMKLSKLEQVFVTYPSWENIGGLPGLSLTLQDIGMPEINIHGPQVIDNMFTSTRKFVILRDMVIKVLDPEVYSTFEDNAMTVTCVPLCLPNSEALQRSPAMQQQVEDSSTDDDIEDYYAYEKNSRNTSPTRSNTGQKKRQSPSVKQDSKRHCSERPGCLSVAYICRLRARAGALSLEACVERGVPPGPLLGRLKAGENITLEDGRVVYSKDVTSPDDPGAIFIVVECPTEEFLDVLLKEEAFVQHQQGAPVKEDIPFLVVHFTPDAIMQNDRYKEWMDRFSSTTNHLVMNDSNKCMGSIAVHRIQYKLNLLDKEVFRLLSDRGIPIQEDIILSSAQMVAESENKLNNVSISGNTSPPHKSPIDTTQSKVIQGKTFCTVNLRPSTTIDTSNKLILQPEEYINETLHVKRFREALHEMERQLTKLTRPADTKEYPKILFLGTGSCIPNKTRNTSGILLQISESESLLMDCGEASYGQLVRYFGPVNRASVLEKLKAIYISHLHADHHIGLIGILKARLRANIKSTLYLIAPKQIMTWLHVYDQHFEKVLDTIKLIPSNEMVYYMKTIDEDEENSLKKVLNMSSVLTAPVRHCPNAFGLAVTHSDGWKITYSGDTIPCDSLIDLGMNSDLLIHEATMEDDLAVECRKKMHSTTTQAIQVGQSMRAKFILLTHFSQRYARIPRFNNSFSSNVGIAFDNMQVRLSDLPKLPFMYPPLKLMFAEHYEEIEQKAVKRQLKFEREAQKGSPSKFKGCVIG